MLVAAMIAVLLGSVSFSAKAEGIKSPSLANGRFVTMGDTIYFSAAETEKVLQLMVCDASLADEASRKKFVSALFAFPFPFGFMGAHRVMLGTKPWIPVVYVATFGGCFGLLPLIDFFVITFSKDISAYENNSQIFMWVK